MLDRYQTRIAIRDPNDECILVAGAVARSPPSAPRARARASIDLPIA
ncbi:hypothetical protein NB311A_13121 [Nitrobacter sp. Nb-311A]|nr:hypothetical protein NB311A_13121 [Nitrobacter sp. Nb-311A]